MKLVNALDFQILYQNLKNQQINIKLAYKLNKLNSRLIEEAEFYRTELYKILEQYAQVDENGNFIQNADGSGYLIKDGLIQECHEKIRELQNIEVENLNITFALDELEDLVITPAELSVIENLIVE